MTRSAILVTVFIALTVGGFGASIRPVVAQHGAIQIVYEEPKNPKLQPIYDTLRKRKVLETLQRFLSPLKLEKTLTIKTAECGGSPFAPYQKGGLATICYEYVDLIDSVLPGERGKGISAPKDYRGLFKNLGRIGPVLVTRNMAAEGPFVEQALHETALGVFDLLDVPIWGRRDDAADFLAAYLMVQFGSDVARKTVYGTAYFLNQLDMLNRSNVMDTDYLSAVHPTIRQRYYNVLCIALGNDPIEFSSFVPENIKGSDVSLPYGRLASCTGQLVSARKITWTDYGKVGAAFAELILPHVDLDMLKKVQNTKWLPDED